MRILFFVLGTLIIGVSPQKICFALSLDNLALALKPSLDQTLEDLAGQFPELYPRTVMIYKSRGLQQADPLHPRLLLSAGDGSLVIAVSTDPRDPRFNTLEIMELSARATIEFHEINFDGGGQGDPKVIKNSPDCRACHMGRPVWDTFPVWPGLYGSVHPDHRDTLSPQWLNQERQDYQRLTQKALGEPLARWRFVQQAGTDQAPHQLGMLIHQFNSQRLAKHLLNLPTAGSLPLPWPKMLQEAIKNPPVAAKTYPHLAQDIERRHLGYLNRKTKELASAWSLPVSDELESWMLAQHSLPTRHWDTVAALRHATETHAQNTGLWSTVFGRHLYEFSHHHEPLLIWEDLARHQ